MAGMGDKLYQLHNITAYSVKISGLTVSSEGWNSTVYPSVADWAHSRKNLVRPMLRCVQVGPVGKGPVTGQQKTAISKIHDAGEPSY